MIYSSCLFFVCRFLSCWSIQKMKGLLIYFTFIKISLKYTSIQHNLIWTFMRFQANLFDLKLAAFCLLYSRDLSIRIPENTKVYQDLNICRQKSSNEKVNQQTEKCDNRWFVLLEFLFIINLYTSCNEHVRIRGMISNLSSVLETQGLVTARFSLLYHPLNGLYNNSNKCEQIQEEFKEKELSSQFNL